MYATEADMIARYGTQELIQLTDRPTTQTNVINSALLEAKIQDAENEINKKLICCFSIKKIKKVYDDLLEIPILKTWTCKIARKNLYDSIRLGVSSNASDHQAQREYEEVIKEIDHVCECGHLIVSDFSVIEKRNVNHFVEDGSCVRYECCEMNEVDHG